MEEDDEIGAATQLAIDEAHAISARQISLLHSKLQGRPLNCLPANGRWREEDPFEHASYISNFHYGLQTRPARYTRAALNATVEPVSRGISTPHYVFGFNNAAEPQTKRDSVSSVLVKP